MLQLRPNCECCDVDLPPESTEAMICTFECTFCTACAQDLLGNVCPNCGGGFSPRPVRPATNWNDDNSLAKYPASTKVKYRPADLQAHQALAARIGSLPPEKR